MEPSFSCGDDLVWISFPDEGFWLAIGLVDEAGDGWCACQNSHALQFSEIVEKRKGKARRRRYWVARPMGLKESDAIASVNELTDRKLMWLLWKPYHRSGWTFRIGTGRS